MRARHLLAFSAVALILALAGCGGGGGGGGGGGTVTMTADVTGRVVDTAGNGIDGATVSADVNRALVTAVTAGGGYYTLQDIPTQTGFTLTVIANGTTLTYQSVRLNSANANGQAPMDIVFTTDPTPTPAGGGTPGISIEPAETTVAVGTSPTFYVQLDLGNEQYIPNFPAVWTISGATGDLSSDGKNELVVTPGAVGTSFKLRATVLVNRDTGQTISAERTLTVTNVDDGPPPMPL